MMINTIFQSVDGEKEMIVTFEQGINGGRHNAVPFYAHHLPDAKRQALEHTLEGGIVASMPQLIKCRNISPFEHEIWDNWYTANSEEHTGRGEFRGIEGNYVLIIHGGSEGGGMLEPEAVEKAYDGNLNSTGGAILSQVFIGKDIFTNALQGGLPNGDAFPLLTYDEAVRDKGARQYIDKIQRFGIVLLVTDVYSKQIIIKHFFAFRNKQSHHTMFDKLVPLLY